MVRLRSQRLLLNFSLAGLALATVAVARSSEPATPEPTSLAVVLAEVPAGFDPGAVLRLPEDHPDSQRTLFEVTLYRVTSPLVLDGVLVTVDDFAIFTRPSTGTIEDVEPTRVDGLGPVGIAGLIGGEPGGNEVIVGARDVDAAQLEALLAHYEDIESLEAVTTVASQERAAVPGIGSLALPAGTPGFAISYISNDGGAVQRSVAVGRFEATVSELEILRWWYGGPPATTDASGRIGFEAILPAFSVNDGSAVPDARYVVWWEAGAVTIVRMVDAGLGGLATLPDALVIPSAADLVTLDLLRPVLSAGD